MNTVYRNLHYMVQQIMSILTNAFLGFTQSHQENNEIISRLGHNCLLSKQSAFSHSPFSLPFSTTNHKNEDVAVPIYP
jgi:hypothetical protein